MGAGGDGGGGGGLFCQAEDGIRDLVRSRGVGDVYKRQLRVRTLGVRAPVFRKQFHAVRRTNPVFQVRLIGVCLLYTSDAADERSSVDLGGRRIIKKKNNVSREAELRAYMTNIKSQRSLLKGQAEC